MPRRFRLLSKRSGCLPYRAPCCERSPIWRQFPRELESVVSVLRKISWKASVICLRTDLFHQIIALVCWTGLRWECRFSCWIIGWDLAWATFNRTANSIDDVTCLVCKWNPSRVAGRQAPFGPSCPYRPTCAVQLLPSSALPRALCHSLSVWSGRSGKPRHIISLAASAAWARRNANSKHWFYIPVSVFRWCSNGSKFVTDNSDYIRRFFYNWPRCLRQHK